MEKKRKLFMLNKRGAYVTSIKMHLYKLILLGLIVCSFVACNRQKDVYDSSLEQSSTEKYVVFDKTSYDKLVAILSSENVAPDVIQFDCNKINFPVTFDIVDASEKLKIIEPFNINDNTLRGQIYIGLKGNNTIVRNFNFERTKLYGKATGIIGIGAGENNTVQNCVFSEKYTKSDFGSYSYFISLTEGKNNRIVNNRFINKTITGAVIVLNKADSISMHHTIQGNYFGPRSYTDNPSDCAIRIGGSGKRELESSYFDGQVQITNNFFDHYNAYYETISCKLGGTTIAQNVFLGCNGYISIRNAKNCRILNNIIDGELLPGTRGIRAGGPGHIIRGNYLKNLTGHSIWLWHGNGDLTRNPTKGYTAPTYLRSRDIEISRNTIDGCSAFITYTKIDAKGIVLPPLNITIRNNTVIHNGDQTETALFLSSADHVASEERPSLQSNIIRTSGLNSKKHLKRTLIKYSSRDFKRKFFFSKEYGAHRSEILQTSRTIQELVPHNY
jgi:hypothetical protein